MYTRIPTQIAPVRLPANVLLLLRYAQKNHSVGILSVKSVACDAKPASSDERRLYSQATQSVDISEIKFYENCATYTDRTLFNVK